MIPLQLDSVYVFQFWGESASGRFLLLPDFPARLSACISGATRSLTQWWARKHTGTETWRMKNSLYFVTAWRYFTEIWNVLRLQIWKHHSNSYPLQLPGIISLDCTLWSKLIPGTCIREQHVWKWLSLWPAHGKQMFSKRFDGIPGSSQSVHNLSFQTYHPPTPVHAQPHEMILQNPLCLFMPPLISALAIFITQNIVWTPVSPSSPAKSLLIF